MSLLLLANRGAILEHMEADVREAIHFNME